MKPRLTPFRKAISRNKLYGILLVIVFGITTSLGVAALTDSQKERVADMVRIIRESAATLSGADLAEYYGAINVGLQDAIQVLTDVRDNVAQNAPASPCGTMPTVVGGIQNMPVCDTVTKQWKNQDGSPVVTAGSTTSTLASSSTNATVTNMNSRNCLKSYGTDIAFVKENANQPFGNGPYGKGGDFRWQPENWAFVLPSSAFDNIKSLDLMLAQGVPNPNAPANDASGLPTLGMHLYECINGERVLIAKDYAAEVPEIRAFLGDYKTYIRSTTYPDNVPKQESEIKRVEQYYFLGYKPNTLYIVEFKNTGNQYRVHRGPYNARNVEQFLAETDLGKAPLASNSQSVPYDVSTMGAYWIGPSSTISSNTTTSTTTSSSPCGPMPTGIGGIQDMPTCGSDGKWRDPSGKVIGGEASSSTSNTQSSQSTTTNSLGACNGTPPTPSSGLVSYGFSHITAGGTTNTTWSYIGDLSESSTSCIWKCTAGYIRSGNTCVAKGPGTGLKVYAYDTFGNPLPGVSIDILKDAQMAGVSSLQVVTTNNQGEAPESFVDKGVLSHMLNVSKTGYILKSAEGCKVRTTRNKYYCDGVKVENSVVRLTLQSENSTSKLSILYPSQSYNMAQKNTLTNEVSGLAKENTKVCVEVLAHPAAPDAVNAGHCSNKNNFFEFTGNADWTYTNGKWIYKAPYDEAIWGAVGIKTRGYWMDKSTGEIISGSIDVIAGSSLKTIQSSNNTSPNTSSVCSGSKPTGMGVESQEVGITTGDTSWHYSSSLGACSWRCSSGYTRSGNSCIQNATSGTNQNTSTTNTSQGTPANEKIRITGKSCNFTGAPQNYYYKMGGTCGGALFNCNNGALEYSSTQFISIVDKPTPTTTVYDTEDLCNGITGSNVKFAIAYGHSTVNCLSAADNLLSVTISNAKEDIEICQEVDIAWRNQRNVCDSTGTEGWVKANTVWPRVQYDGANWNRYVYLLDNKAYVPGKYRFAARSSDGKVVYSNWVTVVAETNAGAEQFVNPRSCIPNRYKPASAEELVNYMLNHSGFWLGFVDYSGLKNGEQLHIDFIRSAEIGGVPSSTTVGTMAYDPRSLFNVAQYFTKSVPTPPSTYKDAYGTVIAGESGNTAYFDFQSWYKGGSAWTAAICSSAHPTTPRPVSQVHGGKAWKSGDKEPTKCN